MSLYDDDRRDFDLMMARKLKRKRNRDIEWINRDGEAIPLAEMENDHLLNTIALLGRKAEAWQRTKALADSKGLKVPEPTMYGKPLAYWSDAMLKELNRRQK